MALDFAHGSVDWLTTDALNATKVITGLGFRPKALRFYWVGLRSASPTNGVSGAVNERRGVGFAVSNASRRCVGTFSLDNDNGGAQCGSVAMNTCVAVTVTAAGAVDGQLDISSFDADGFTLIVDDVTPANITVFWEAWGGTDITSAVVGDIAEPAATGTQNYTVSGFTSDGRNQCVMFAGVQSVNAVNTGQGQDSGLCVGFASSTASTNNVVVVGNSDTGSDPTDTDGYCIQGECLAQIVIAGGNPNARAALSAWGTDLFTLNWTNRATTNRRNIFLAIKGGSWSASSYTIAGNTLNSTTTVLDLPFFPLRGISLIGRMTAQSTAGTSTAQDRIGFGSGRSTASRNSAGVLDNNNADPTAVGTIVQYNSVLSYPTAAGAVTATYDINAFNLNQFQIIVDTAGGVASEFHGYLAFGDQMYPRIQSVGHPFII
jgi:hypothetical protein